MFIVKEADFNKQESYSRIGFSNLLPVVFTIQVNILAILILRSVFSFFKRFSTNQKSVDVHIHFTKNWFGVESVSFAMGQMMAFSIL